jgi:hypothetical protein
MTAEFGPTAGSGWGSLVLWGVGQDTTETGNQ